MQTVNICINPAVNFLLKSNGKFRLTQTSSWIDKATTLRKSQHGLLANNVCLYYIGFCKLRLYKCMKLFYKTTITKFGTCADCRTEVIRCRRLKVSSHPTFVSSRITAFVMKRNLVNISFFISRAPETQCKSTIHLQKRTRHQINSLLNTDVSDVR
jgi:hypothetical protein